MKTVYRICFFLFFSFCVNQGYTQSCQGSLGDPIVNITFGSGSNPGGQLSSTLTTYAYQQADCPNDGYYTIRNNTVSCYSNTWQTINADHTGDPGGYFMLMNATLQPGAFYEETVTGLCGNTTYEFAAWIINILLQSSCGAAGIQPNITFSIEKTDGTILQSYNTGNIPATANPTWKQYGFFFTTPAGVSDIVFRMVNNAPGGCGNDLAMDDITIRPCGPLITGFIDGLPDMDTSFCAGVQQQFVVSCNTSGGFINPNFQWQSRDPLNANWTDIPGANSNRIIKLINANTPPGTYQLRLAIAGSGNLNSIQCRVYSQPFTFIIKTNPVTTANNNGPVCEGGMVTLIATGGLQYSWNGPNGYTAFGSPLQLGSVSLNQAGKYLLTATNSNGCMHKDSTTLIINPSPSATTSLANATICAGDSIQLAAGGGTTYLWSPSRGLSGTNLSNPKASPAKTTAYIVKVSNQFACSDTAGTIVNVIQRPFATAGPDKSILKGQSVQLGGVLQGQQNFSWSPPLYINDIHAEHPIVTPPADMVYILNVAPGFGCGSSSDSVLVKVYNDIYIPNAFSPNGDGLNDTWSIPGLDNFNGYELRVYNRYGQVVFQNKIAGQKWDGTFKSKLLPIGAYCYILDLKQGRKILKGIVYIVR